MVNVSLRGIYASITSVSGTMENSLTLLALMNAGIQKLRKVDISDTCSLRRMLVRDYGVSFACLYDKGLSYDLSESKNFTQFISIFNLYCIIIIIIVSNLQSIPFAST